MTLPALRHFCVSGEQLLVDDEIRAFFVAHPHAELVNLYGPTETHAVTSHRLSGSEPEWPEHVPIGLPFTGVHGHVVDVSGHLAPVGVPGELYLGGVCPADGYINDPDTTAARFLPDRFGAADGRMYRTGDRVVRDEHGTLTFLGREDTQVKIRGYRVELGEIETCANALASVGASVALARGTGADRELVLFTIAEPGSVVDHDEVRARLTASLPGYMVPGWIFDTDAVPISATGKTDRDTLLAVAEQRIAEQRIEAAAQPVEYADELERGLTEIWLRVLDVGAIAPDRPLLEYGAHSISIFTALAEVQATYGVSVGLVEFFGAPTVAALTATVRAGLASAEETA